MQTYTTTGTHTNMHTSRESVIHTCIHAYIHAYKHTYSKPVMYPCIHTCIHAYNTNTDRETGTLANIHTARQANREADIQASHTHGQIGTYRPADRATGRQSQAAAVGEPHPIFQYTHTHRQAAIQQGRHTYMQADRQAYSQGKQAEAHIQAIKDDRQTANAEGHTEGPRDREAGIYTGIHTYIQPQAGRQAGRQACRQTDRQTGRQTDRQTERQTD